MNPSQQVWLETWKVFVYGTDFKPLMANKLRDNTVSQQKYMPVLDLALCTNIASAIKDKLQR